MFLLRFTFIIECAAITILNKILSTILLFYDFVGIYKLWLFCWNLLTLTIIYINGK